MASSVLRSRFLKIVFAGPTDVNQLADLTGQPAPVNVHSFGLTADIVRQYVQMGHQVHVIVQSSEVTSSLTYGTESLSVTIVPVRRALHTVPSWFRREVREIKDAILKAKPDVVHAHWTYEYARGGLASGLPILITAHDAPTRIWRMMKPKYFWWPKLLQAALVARTARHMTAVSPYTADVWSNELGYKGSMQVVPNGLPESLLSGARAPRQPREPGGWTFVAVGQGFSDRKNTSNLIKAFQLVRKSHPEAKLVLFGSDHGPGQLAETWAKNNSSCVGIEFAGRQPHASIMEALRERADVYVHPSLEESCCRAVLEAMAHNLPIVGGKNSGGVPWQLDEGNLGLLCDVLNPQDLAQSMIAAQSNSELGKSGLSVVEAKYAIDRISNQYLDILGSLTTAR